jgi:hypothetical protein
MRVDLSGPEGNAYALMNIAQRIGTQLNRSYDEMEKIQRKMMSGDYNNLLKVLFLEYGDFIEFVEDGKRVLFIRNKGKPMVSP